MDKLKKQNGQSLVEAAFILPIILMILCGIIDFGLLFNDQLVITNASREGARNAAVGNNDEHINTIISNITDSMDQEKLTVVITPNDLNRNKGDTVVVTITYQYDVITPLISAILPSPLLLESKTSMRME